MFISWKMWPKNMECPPKIIHPAHGKKYETASTISSGLRLVVSGAYIVNWSMRTCLRLCNNRFTYAGWWFQPLWKILVSWDYDSQYMEKNVPNHQPDMFWTHFKNAHPLHPFLWFCPAFSSNDQGVSRGFDPFIPKRGQASARWKDASRASFDLERCRGWESHRTPALAFSWSLRLESSGFFNGFWVIQFLESAQVHEW